MDDVMTSEQADALARAGACNALSQVEGSGQTDGSLKRAFLCCICSASSGPTASSMPLVAA